MDCTALMHKTVNGDQNRNKENRDAYSAGSSDVYKCVLRAEDVSGADTAASIV
jgi:hypothetical protein